MNRFLLAGLLVAPALVVAAPVPKDETGRIARVYGTIHDPDKGAEFRNVGDTLILGVPLAPRLFAPFEKIANGPRVWRDVRGNFTVTVRVSFPIRPKIPEKHKDAAIARASGGLVVWLNQDSYLTFTRDERASDSAPGEYFRSEWCHKGSIQGAAHYTTPQRSGYLRIVRWDKGLACSYNPDGKKWKSLDSYPIEWGEVLKVGVVAENGFQAPFEVTFDEHALAITKE